MWNPFRNGIKFNSPVNRPRPMYFPPTCTYTPFLLYRHDLLIKISPMPLHVETLPSPPDSILFTSEAVLVQCKPPLMLDRENVQACTIRTACGRGRVFSSLLISPGVCAKCQLPTRYLLILHLPSFVIKQYRCACESFCFSCRQS